MTRLLVILGLLVAASGCASQKNHAAHIPPPTKAACSRLTAVRNAIAHLRSFDVWGVGLRPSRVAIAPLYPHYPEALLTAKIGIAPHKKSDDPVTVEASYCNDRAAIRLFQASRDRSDLNLPRPASASTVAKAGSPSVQLVWPPPIHDATDPDRWFITPLFYKPGIAVITFRQGARVLDNLIVRVCLGDVTGRCQAR